ncbi:MAG: hypothetical protein V1749_05030 [Candidatus Desantisbacteria bacterium]
MKRIIRDGQKICAVVLAVMMFVATFAYAADMVYLKEGIIWLKNGSMVKGEIIAIAPDKSYTIQTKETNKKTFVYKVEEIEKIQIGIAKPGVVEEEEEMLVDITNLPIETVYLTDGSKINGKIFEVTPGKSYKIKTTDAISVYPVEKIDKIKSAASERSDEVVCLKDGNTILGRIIETVIGKSYKIRTADGSDFVVAMERIEKIERVKGVREVGLREPKIPKEEAGTTPSGSITTSIGGGIDSFGMNDVNGDVEGIGSGVTGDLRFMGKKCGIQFEVGSKKYEGDNNSGRKETNKCSSYGVTALLSCTVSPKTLFYGGFGVSQYSWDNLEETPWIYQGSFSAAGQLSQYNAYKRNPKMQENGYGYHLCGGAECAISKNLSFWGEIRQIIGTIENPTYIWDAKATDSYGNTVVTTTYSSTGKNWDYGHTDVRAGLRLSF